MSASNWSPCPSCKQFDEQRRAELKRRMTEGYGSLPISEYEDLRRQVEEPRSTADTLREDWELGVGEDGNFRLYYGCICEVCGFKYTFKTIEPAMGQAVPS